MTLQRFVLSAVVATVSIALHLSAFAQTAIPGYRIVVSFRPDLNTFEVDATPYGPFFGERAIAPDGTIFGDLTTNINDIVRELTADDLTSRFAGEWTFISASPSPGTQYRFSISSEQLLHLAPEPEILSPIEGADVPAVFDMQHTGTGYLLECQSLDGNFRSRTSSTGVHVDQSHRDERFPLYAKAWATNATRETIGPITPVSGTSPELFVALTTLSYSSSPKNWVFVVPEPASFTLISTCSIALVALCRRK